MVFRAGQIAWLLVISLQLASGGLAAEVKMDLLGGIGGFEYCGDTQWNVYAHPDYDFAERSGWVSDERSALTIKSDVHARTSGTDRADRVTVSVKRYPDGPIDTRIYEFTNGSAASPGCTMIDIGSDPSPTNAAAQLTAAIARQLGAAGRGALEVSHASGTVYVKPKLHWELTSLQDSDLSELRIATIFRTWRYGFDPPTPEDSVAVGWVRKSGNNVNPGANCTFRITDGGLQGSKRQYLALKSLLCDEECYAMLSSSIPVSTKPSDLHAGDQVTFALDSARMAGYATLPAGTSATFWVQIRAGAGNVVTKTLPVSESSVPCEISSAPIASGVRLVEVQAGISVRGNLIGKEVGLYVDGAHLYVKRAERPSAFATWQVPVARNRGVRTLVYSQDWDGSSHDLYNVASQCDAVILGERYGKLAAQLRYLNPEIKIYNYEIAAAIDYRDARGLDPWYANTPMKLGWVLANHPEWLYPDGLGSYVHASDGSGYCFRLTDAGAAAYWAQRARDIALRWKYDGIFIDSLIPLKEERSGRRLKCPQRDPWEVQAFLRQVMPVFRAADLEVIQNICSYHLSKPPGAIFMDPSWVPSSPYNTKDYKANEAQYLADAFFQEYGFNGLLTTKRNYYRTEYWKASLDDMDAAEKWNLAAKGQPNKRYCLLALGWNSPEDPASGIDGWMRFGLCSYLLGQNEYTTFSSGERGSYAHWTDVSVTKRLGKPAAPHQPYNSDDYVRYRYYAATADGGVGGVVVVNAHTDRAIAYRVPFDVVDENGARLSAGTTMNLKPHAGRILLRPSY